MGPEVTGSLCGFNHRTDEKRNVGGISMPSKTFQPVTLNGFCLCLAEGLHTHTEQKLWL